MSTTDNEGRVHIEDDDARGAETTGVMRYVLGISLLLAAVAMTIAWVSGALSQGDVESEMTVTGTNEAREDGEVETSAPTSDEAAGSAEPAAPSADTTEAE